MARLRVTIKIAVSVAFVWSWCGSSLGEGQLAAFGARQDKSQGVEAIFMRYARGQFAEARADLEGVADFGAFALEVKHLSAAWPPKTRAAFLLESAEAALTRELKPQPIQDFSAGIILSGGNRLRPSKQDYITLFDEAWHSADLVQADATFDRLWCSAALSLLQGAQEFLPLEEANGGPPVKMLERFLGGTKERLAPGQWWLATAGIKEAAVFEILDYDLPTYYGLPQQTAASYIGRLKGQLDRARDAAIDALGHASQYPESHAMSLVRLGILTSEGERPDFAAALRSCEQAKSSGGDESTRYLASICEGRVFAFQNRPQDAARAFREALAFKQSAGSALLGLASALFITGDADEANTLVQELLGASNRADDPWALYVYGDYVNFPARLAALRAAVQ